MMLTAASSYTAKRSAATTSSAASAAAAAAAADNTTTTTEKQQDFPPPLWEDCDTPEEILDEEKYGAGDDSSAAVEVTPEMRSEHFQLAYRALYLGTIYAVIGVSMLTLAGMYVCGFGFSFTSLFAYFRNSSDRYADTIHAKGDTIIPLSLDLTDASTLVPQWRAITSMITELSAREEEMEKTEKE